MSVLRRLAIGAIATLWSGAAWAQEWTLADCDHPGGQLNYGALIKWRADSAGFSVDDVNFLNRLGARWGDEALESNTTCANPSEEVASGCANGLSGKFQNLFLQTDELLTGSLPTLENGFTVVRSSSGLSRVEQIRAALNGPVAWLRVSCPSQVAANAETPPAARGFFGAITEHLIVGRSEDDADRDMGDREFATVSFTDDRAADTETTAIEMYLGWQFGTQRANRRLMYQLTPFISLQKTSIEQDGPATGETDDLTFGASGTFWVLGDTNWGRHIISPTLSWGTDTNFDSSVMVAALDWTPVGLGSRCLGRYLSEDFRLRCDYAFVVDHLNVSDPGEKVELLTRQQFTRVGYDFRLDYYQRVGAGDVNFGVGYQRRDDISDEGGDADLISAVLQFMPGAESHFSIGVEYRQGEDLTNLEPSQTTLLRIGYRR